MEIDYKIVEQAYKKLKSSVYFDKTQLILRNSIVEYETEDDIDNRLKMIYESLLDENAFAELNDEILQSITVSSFPKKLANNEQSIIMNTVSPTNVVEELQHFIDMSVEGHILGVLWIMLIGYRIDKNIYEHSYGNRIRKNLINELSDKPTYSPYLFEPYFQQYESWRDKAMSEAENHMKMNQDVVIITMDFKRYYYSIDADKIVFESLFDEAFPEKDEQFFIQNKILLERLNNFIFSVIQKYASLFVDYDNRRILPIGFLPSNIIGNWCLNKFDKAIIEGWNPVYYGRYVDDVIIVDKIERNSDIFQKANANTLTKEEAIEFFLTNCTKWNGMTAVNCECSSKYAVLELFGREKKDDNSYENIYRINPRYNVIPKNKSEIIVQNDKLKLFYFQSKESDALLTCFKENISRNKSEFRHLPEDEAVFQRDDYSEIYNLESSDTINKLRGINGVSLDKFKLSKFLGKYLRIGGMIQDKIEFKFVKDILKIYNYRVVLESYTTWEKIIEIFIINEDFLSAEKFIEQIINAIDSIQCNSEDSAFKESHIKETMFRYLHSALCRCFALVWKKECFNLLRKIYLKDNFVNSLELKYNSKGSSEPYLKKLLASYCLTGMVDKSVMPIIIFMLSIEDLFSDETEVNLTHFSDVLPLSTVVWDDEYKYFPYMVNMYDFSMIMWIEELQKETPFLEMDKIHKRQTDYYINSNYCIEEGSQQWNKISDLVNVREFELEKQSYLVSAGTGKKQKIKIAIANVKLNHENFAMLVKDSPNRTYKRYKDLSTLVNQAIDQNVDMLIMPEAYLPYEWLATLARTCARNNLAIITGIEHIKINKNVYNFTAVILPYEEEQHKSANISFHLKNHYAPSEKEEINGYQLSEVEGKHYELYKWNDCYFPVYCCYELTSITDRSLFQSYADMLIAVEWNKDINYYSNILESLSRDIHCYCIQVNTSNYGDSRITKPSKTEEKDIIRTKGGINSSILVETIDINQLRDFQIKDYSLQKKDGKFKATPPDFKRAVVMKKIKQEQLY